MKRTIRAVLIGGEHAGRYINVIPSPVIELTRVGAKTIHAGVAVCDWPHGQVGQTLTYQAVPSRITTVNSSRYDAVFVLVEVDGEPYDWATVQAEQGPHMCDWMVDAVLRQRNGRDQAGSAPLGS